MPMHLVDFQRSIVLFCHLARLLTSKLEVALVLFLFEALIHLVLFAFMSAFIFQTFPYDFPHF